MGRDGLLRAGAIGALLGALGVGLAAHQHIAYLESRARRAVILITPYQALLLRCEQLGTP